MTKSQKQYRRREGRIDIFVSAGRVGVPVYHNFIYFSVQLRNNVILRLLRILEKLQLQLVSIQLQNWGCAEEAHIQRTLPTIRLLTILFVGTRVLIST